VPLIATACVAAFLWGAGHALTPGHGKTIAAAYLIGSRSSAWHAVYLGLVFTLTHTLGVFALGGIALFASRYVLPVQLYPWLGAASGVMVAGIGAVMLWRRVRSLLARRGEDPAHAHSHGHSHDHDHGHAHFHGDEHQHDHEQAGGHVHPLSETDGSPVTWQSLLGLGVSGGLFPCPGALVLLLSAIAVNRTALGILLVAVFSLGLAAVLTAVGLIFIKGGRLVARVPQASFVLRYLPVASAGIIMAIGISLVIEMVWHLRR
jgi:ABC-type nickel/cobalt efflux system permease component RcnA